MKTLDWVETFGYHLFNPLASVCSFRSRRVVVLTYVYTYLQIVCLVQSFGQLSLTCSLFSSGLLGASLLKCSTVHLSFQWVKCNVETYECVWRCVSDSVFPATDRERTTLISCVLSYECSGLQMKRFGQWGLHNNWCNTWMLVHYYMWCA